MLHKAKFVSIPLFGFQNFHLFIFHFELFRLGLLWYHTVIRPFFALDGGNVDAGTEDATALIERCEKEYPHSALFLFFKGRVERLKVRCIVPCVNFRIKDALIVKMAGYRIIRQAVSAG